MLEEKKENILEDNYYLKKRKKARLKTRFLAIKNRLFILGIVFGILITAVLYLMLPSSEVFTTDLNLIPKSPTISNFIDALEKVPLFKFVFIQDKEIFNSFAIIFLSFYP